jgi:hypothetical protein
VCVRVNTCMRVCMCESLFVYLCIRVCVFLGMNSCMSAYLSMVISWTYILADN